MAKYKVCDRCGAALDPGERCDCRVAKEAPEAAPQTEGWDDAINMSVVKMPGGMGYDMTLSASSFSAGLTGVALLVSELADRINAPSYIVLRLIVNVLEAGRGEHRDAEGGVPYGGEGDSA